MYINTNPMQSRTPSVSGAVCLNRVFLFPDTLSHPSAPTPFSLQRMASTNHLRFGSYVLIAIFSPLLTHFPSRSTYPIFTAADEITRTICASVRMCYSRFFFPLLTPFPIPQHLPHLYCRGRNHTHNLRPRTAGPDSSRSLG